MSIFLSIVIPAYNEESRIIPTLTAVREFLKARPFSWDILVVDDGSVDSTAALVEKVSMEDPRVRLVSVPHGGKGWAVKHGMLEVEGELRFICDADLSMPIDNLSKFLEVDYSLYPVVIGSREIMGARRFQQPISRRLMGRILNLLVRIVGLARISDTQCGFKSFSGAVAEDLFGLQRLNGWGFDVEILFLAKMRKYGVLEIPIDWYYDHNTRVNRLRDGIRTFGELFKIKWNQLRRIYHSPTKMVNDRGRAETLGDKQLVELDLDNKNDSDSRR